MSGYLKFEPHPWSTPLLRASLGAHVVLPLAAGYLTAPVFASGNAAIGWLGWALAAGAYFGYLVFALILHLEFFPEKPALVLRLLAWPVGWTVVASLVAELDVTGAAATLGALIFAGIELSVAVSFFAGTRVGVRFPDKPAGEGGLRWRRDGRSMWRDADFSAMTRWTMALVFFLPGAATLVFIARGLLPLLGGWPLAAWGVPALVTVALCYLRILAGLTDEGRIFGPGKSAFG